MKYLGSKGVKSVAVVADDGRFPQANAKAMADAAEAAGMKVLAKDTLPASGGDLAPRC